MAEQNALYLLKGMGVGNFFSKKTKIFSKKSGKKKKSIILFW